MGFIFYFLFFSCRKGLGVDGGLIARLRELEIQEASGRIGEGGQKEGEAGDGEHWI
jgi:hypothetical protein